MGNSEQDDRKRELNRLAQQRYRDRHRQPPEPRPCVHCGTLFTPARYSGSRACYCSAVCRARAQTQRKRQERLG